MAEIVLIQPYTGSWDEMSIRLPESLLAVASVPAAKGYDVRIIDQRISKSFETDLAQSIGPETKIVGITAITGEQVGYALKVTQLVKTLYPSVPVCWGGVHATLVPDQTAAHPLIDFVVVGDGEYVFCELFEHLRDGLPLDGLRGIIYKTGDEIKSNVGTIETKYVGEKGNYTYVRKNGAADVIRDLDSLPPPPYHLLDFDKYSVFHTSDSSLSATLSTSRGCPYRCKFCSDPVINEGAWRGLSKEKIVERVKFLYDTYGVTTFFFQDDYFPGSKPRFIGILNELSKFEGKIRWSTLGIRADMLAKLTDEEFDLLYRSGCFSLEVGVETGNERVLKMVHKGETLEEMLFVNRKLAKYDITVKYTLIVGFPTETEEEVMDSLRFAARLEKDNPHSYCLIFNFLPIIGTPFYYEALKQGFSEPKTLEEWAHMDFDNWMRHYRSWASPKLVDWLQAINFVSYFHNPNVKYKFSGSKLLRISFALYHPIAAWRFRNHFYSFFFERHLKHLVLGTKYAFRRIVKSLMKLKTG